MWSSSSSSWQRNLLLDWHNPIIHQIWLPVTLGLKKKKVHPKGMDLRTWKTFNTKFNSTVNGSSATVVASVGSVGCSSKSVRWRWPYHYIRGLSVLNTNTPLLMQLQTDTILKKFLKNWNMHPFSPIIHSAHIILKKEHQQVV